MIWTGVMAIAVAWFLAWLFARAALHKLAAPRYYRELMTRYVGGAGGGIAVWLLASMEAGIALSLLYTQWRPAGLAAAAALLLAYAGLMAWQIHSGRAGMDCGCAGPDSQLGISWALVIRNGACAVLAVLAMCATAVGNPGWIAYAGCGALALLFAIAYLTSEAVISNAQWMAGDG